MPQAVRLDYFYRNEAEQFAFYRIPKILVTDERYRGVSSDAKILYGLMLDRMSLSIKNGWIDNEGRVYIFFTLEDAQEQLSCGHGKAVKMFDELDTQKGVGLIERKRQGQGRPAIIYVKNFATVNTASEAEPVPNDPDFRKAEIKTSQKRKSRLPKIERQDFRKSEVKTSENRTSRLPKNGSADFRKSNGSYTENSKTEGSDNQSVCLSAASDEKMPTDGQTDATQMCLEEVLSLPPDDDTALDPALVRDSLKRQIEYDWFAETYPEDLPGIDVLLDTMTEMLTAESTAVCGYKLHREALKPYIDRVDSCTVRDFIDHMRGQSMRGVKNIGSYWRSSFLNFLREQELIKLTV